MSSRIFGSGIRRREDPRLITGSATYTHDIVLPGMVHAAMLRSSHAHARITRIDTEKAKTAPGVVAVYTGADIEGALQPVPCAWLLPDSQLKVAPYPCIAKDTVRYTGDIVAVVVAETPYQAYDALDLIEVDYEPLPTVTDPEKAAGADAPQLHAKDINGDDISGNQAFHWTVAGGGDLDAAFAEAESNGVVIKERILQQRLIPNAMEPRGAVAQYTRATGELTLWNTTQNPHIVRFLCSVVTGVPEDKLRVIAPEVGGGFGSKIFHYPEEAIVTWCARKTGRPVKWTASRSESFMTDAHGRDHVTRADLALDAGGKFLALRVRTQANMGAYLSLVAPAIPTYLYGTLLQGQYTTPAVHVEVTAAFTNTTPVDAYRGAGRPEATYLLERLVDTAAHETGTDPAELRRKNLIPPFDGVTQEGYQTQVAMVYDSGNYEGALDRALEVFDVAAFRAKQEAARAEGRLIGVGFSSYIEACGVAPSKVAGALGARGGFYESSTVRVQPSGKVTVFTGTHSHGQGHVTTFAQVVADGLGVPMEDVEIVHGDTDMIPMGNGTAGSRSIAVGGSAIAVSLGKIKEKGAQIAAHLIEASPEDLEYVDGGWKVRGTDRGMSFQEVAAQAYTVHNYPDGVEPGLEFTSFFDPENFTFPFGTHIAVVKIDADTGQVRLKRFVAVDDVGLVINPMIVDGQVHGGITQGVGQALLEAAAYDDAGQLLTGSYMDYAMPRADDVPSYEVDRTETRCPINPLGVKGAGETGTIGSTPAVVNAAVDALWHLGVRDLQMPLTPQRVWRAMHANGGTT
jgi:carbon-monoxide dehydrogenase large subunit